MKTKQFRVTSLHDVYVESFQDGEMEHTNTYFLDQILDSDNFINAIKEYFSNFLGYDFELKYCDKDGVDLLYSVLVDSDNVQATEHEQSQWKSGDLKLYSNNITIQCYELKKIDFTSNNKFFNN